jgi:uncharacterized membrane protein
VVLIVTALAARPSARLAALPGAAVGLGATVLVGVFLYRPLDRLPETHMKYLVVLLLSRFGTFFTAEGLAAPWPLAEATLLVLMAVYLAVSQAMVAPLTRAAGTPARLACGGAGP